MTDSFERYAVYYAPEAGSALGGFGNAWLGWDPARDEVVNRLAVDGLESGEIADVAGTPSRYGFHGTLKPPFRLAAGAGYEDLAGAVADIAERNPAFEVPGLRLSALGAFIALIPDPDDGPIRALAAELVRELDGLRAPLSDEELAHRRKSGLTGRQDALLAKWGYPYVMEEFRFHLTLTGALSDGMRAKVFDALRPVLRPIEEEPFRFRSICIFGDPGSGRPFRLLDRFTLSG